MGIAFRECRFRVEIIPGTQAPRYQVLRYLTSYPQVRSFLMLYSVGRSLYPFESYRSARAAGRTSPQPSGHPGGGRLGMRLQGGAMRTTAKRDRSSRAFQRTGNSVTSSPLTPDIHRSRSRLPSRSQPSHNQCFLKRPGTNRLHLAVRINPSSCLRASSTA